MEKLYIDRTELKNKCVNNGDGIYAYFCDHLSMDANQVFVVKDGKLTNPSKECLAELKIRENDVRGHEFELLMNSDSSYYNTIGFSHGIQILRKHYPGLKVYYCNVGWYTFPSCWLRINKDTCYRKSCDEWINIIDFEDENKDLDSVISK